MIAMIDNYDSFTWNLVQYLWELGADVSVFRNDEISVEELAALRPSHVVISPGPCTPNEAGITLGLIARLAGKAPILGVCLGHQAIGQAFGGKVVRAGKVMHGKTSRIHHDGKGVFAGIPTKLFEVVEAVRLGRSPDVKILVGGALEVLKALPADSVHCVVTSPPYWALRDYGLGTWEGGDPKCDHKRETSRADRPSGGLQGGTASVDAMPGTTLM